MKGKTIALAAYDVNLHARIEIIPEGWRFDHPVWNENDCFEVLRALMYAQDHENTKEEFLRYAYSYYVGGFKSTIIVDKGELTIGKEEGGGDE